MTKARERRPRGFTLLELMIVVVVVSILGMVAYPSYTSYVQRNGRAEAKAALMNAAQAMERFFTTNNAYPATLAAGGIRDFTGESNANSRYSLSLTVLGTAYTLRATPSARQSGDPCGTLAVNQAGVKTVESATWAASKCW